jgi:hypothetical protein
MLDAPHAAEGTVWSLRACPAASTHAIAGAALLAVRLGEEARGVRGLDVLRRSVDRAPPAGS